MLFQTSIFLALLAVTVILFLLICKRIYSYWDRKGVPGPKPTILFGNLDKLVSKKKTLGEIWRDIYFEYKTKGYKFVGAYQFFVPTLVIVDLELVKGILTTDFNHFWSHGLYVNENDNTSCHLFASEGPKWKRIRGKMSPLFTSGKIKTLCPVILSTCKEMIDVLDKASKDGPVDLKEIASRFAIDNIGRIAFGIKCDSLHNPDEEFRKYGSKVTDKLDLEGTLRQYMNFFVSHSLLRSLNFYSQAASICRFYNKVVKETIQLRKEKNIVGNDLLQLLIEMTTAEDPITIDDIVAQSFVMFVAGYETTASLISFSCYELARHQDIQEKARAEIQTVMKKHNGELTYEACMEMIYLDMIMFETLRMYSPLPFLFRRCSKRYVIPETDTVIEEGTQVVIPLMGIHYDPEFYPDPEKFDPERYNEENKATRPSYTWMPFGEGPRICIGMRLAHIEAKLGLCDLLRNYRITLNERTRAPIVLSKAGVLTNAEGSVWFNLERIK